MLIFDRNSEPVLSVEQRKGYFHSNKKLSAWVSEAFTPNAAIADIRDNAILGKYTIDGAVLVVVK